jgi:diacylglycerol kinase family enzyme
MSRTRRVRVVLNARSGAGTTSGEAICAEFAKHGCVCEVTELGPGADLTELMRADDEQVVWVAAGGDGTVNAVARVVAGSERAMAVLPAGTLNHFARDVGMPMDLNASIEVVARCGWRRLDVGEANGNVFVNCSSLGIYPEVVLERDRMSRSRRWSKWRAMLVASTKAFVRFRQLHVELEVEGVVRRWRTPLLFVGNNAYEMEGSDAGRRRCMDEGELAVVVASGMTRWAALRMMAAALVGRVKGLPELEEFVVTGFTVKSRKRRMRVAFDGEVRRLAPPIVYRSRPGALKVIVPEASEGEVK